MNPYLVVGLIAVGLSVFNIVVTKLVMDEDKLKEARERMKENQKKLRSLDPNSKEYNKIQEQVIKDSMLVTKESYKPMMYTMVIFMLALWWLSANYAYAPISVNNTIFLSVSGNVVVNSACLNITDKKAPFSGNYLVGSKNCTFDINGTTIHIPLGINKPISNKTDIYSYTIKPPKLVFIKLPFSLPFIGDKIGYFGYYLIISLSLGTVLNKLLKNKRFRIPRKSP